MKVYTKKGDDGKTSLLGGKRIAKHDIRIEGYGTIDELNSWVGYMAVEIDIPEVKNELENIQIELFNIGSHLAADPEKAKLWLPALDNTQTELLEKQIDKMEETLPEMKNFILPGGNSFSSKSHIARTVCRRAERIINVLIDEKYEVHPAILPYLNRLSDYLFVLARWETHRKGVKETYWKPRG